MSDHDRAFFDQFMLVLASLVGITIVIYILAGIIADRTEGVYRKQEAIAAQLLEERIKPVGIVAVAGEEEPAQPAATAPSPSGGPAPATVAVAAAAPAAAAQEMSGADVYQSACALCHGAGIAGAPKLGDAAAWSARIEQGMEVLAEHAINGFQGSAGVMPAKGGRIDLSDDAVKAAVAYMVENSQ